MIPAELRYTDKHEWITTEPGTARVGITDFAQRQLGDIVHVALPQTGTALRRDEPFGEVESPKSVSEVYAPIDGTVVACNDALRAMPDLINSDPYGAGWLIEIELVDPSAIDGLLDAAGYAELTERS